MVCTKCETHLAEGVRFCPICGGKGEEAPKEKKTQEYIAALPGERIHITISAVLIILSLLIVPFLPLYIGRLPGESYQSYSMVSTIILRVKILIKEFSENGIDRYFFISISHLLCKAAIYTLTIIYAALALKDMIQKKSGDIFLQWKRLRISSILMILFTTLVMWSFIGEITTALCSLPNGVVHHGITSFSHPAAIGSCVERSNATFSWLYFPSIAVLAVILSYVRICRIVYEDGPFRENKILILKMIFKVLIIFGLIAGIDYFLSICNLHF